MRKRRITTNKKSFHSRLDFYPGRENGNSNNFNSTDEDNDVNFRTFKYYSKHEYECFIRYNY